MSRILLSCGAPLAVRRVTDAVCSGRRQRSHPARSNGLHCCIAECGGSSTLLARATIGVAAVTKRICSGRMIPLLAGVTVAARRS